MTDIKIDDLNPEMEITEDEMKHVKGGIGLLLPAVQKVREAASSTTTQKVLGDGSVKTVLGDGSV